MGNRTAAVGPHGQPRTILTRRCETTLRRSATSIFSLRPSEAEK
jgi:hypothetical protein